MPDPLKSISVGEIRRRLGATRIPDDPLAVDLEDMRKRLPEDVIQKLCKDLKAAAVLIPIIERAGLLTVLLTERSADLKHHAGQVSFPGGAMESDDANISHTALREAEEEVGIQSAEVEIAGYLGPALTVSGFAVTPVVGFVSNRFRLEIDPGEVETAFEVPLDFLLDNRNAAHSEREIDGVTYPVTTFHFSGHRIWGATAHMLLRFRSVLISNKNNRI